MLHETIGLIYGCQMSKQISLTGELMIFYCFLLMIVSIDLDQESDFGLMEARVNTLIIGLLKKRVYDDISVK